MMRDVEEFIFHTKEFNIRNFMNHLKAYLDKIDIKMYNEYLLNVIFTNILLDLNYMIDHGSKSIQIIALDNKITEFVDTNVFLDSKILSSKLINTAIEFRCVYK